MRKYVDNGNSNEVNYYQFCRDVDIFDEGNLFIIRDTSIIAQNLCNQELISLNNTLIRSKRSKSSQNPPHSLLTTCLTRSKICSPVSRPRLKSLGLGSGSSLEISTCSGWGRLPRPNSGRGYPLPNFPYPTRNSSNYLSTLKLTV